VNAREEMFYEQRELREENELKRKYVFVKAYKTLQSIKSEGYLK
jgi:hypothetical protein